MGDTRAETISKGFFQSRSHRQFLTKDCTERAPILRRLPDKLRA